MSPKLSEHHLVPKSRGGRATEAICFDCHSMVHTLYDNRQLERELHTVEALCAEPRFARYLAWMRKRPGNRRYRVRGRRR